MARTELTVQEISRSGLDPSYGSADATNDHSWDNTGENIYIHIWNGGGGAINATFQTPGTVDGQAISDLVVNIPAGEDKAIGPFPRQVYEQEDEDNEIERAVLLDLDGDTSVTIAAIRLPEPTY